MALATPCRQRRPWSCRCPGVARTGVVRLQCDLEASDWGWGWGYSYVGSTNFKKILTNFMFFSSQ